MSNATTSPPAPAAAAAACAAPAAAGGVPAPAAAPTAPGVDAALVELAKTLGQLGRQDLVDRASAAAARLRRPGTIVCVVGEFKQGKSSLVNGLLGTDVCPVDDDLATSAITLVRYGEEPAAVVRRRVDGQATAERVTVDQLHDWISEQGNPGNAKGVERVEIAVPSALLKQGLVVVDTPGMGGLGAGHAAATLAFLPFADGLVLVSDASAELSAPEVDFLRRATELCPTVMFAQTKIDLYPAAERIVELNRGHLERQGLQIPIVAVSSTLRTAALARRDRELNERSRFPQLLKLLNDTIVGPAKSLAGERATSDVRSLVGLVRSELEQEKGAISDPAKVEASLAELQRAKERLEHLKGPAARWNVLLGDRVGDLSTEVNHRFRSGMRTVSRTMDERIEALTKGTEWDELSRHLQTLVADEVTRAFVALEQGRDGTRADVVTLLQEEHLALPSTTRRAKPLDVSELWQGKALDDKTGSTGKRAFQTGLTGIKGAQSGVMMFGMLGGFLPGAAAVLLASNPVLLGVGAVFGGMQLAEDRKRKVAMRRQAARGQVRQFLDDVQFEVGNSLTNVVRDVQRELRDEFTERITQLQRSYAEAANRAQAEAQRGQQAMQTRSAEIDQQLTRLAAIEQLAAQGAPS